MPLYAPKNLSFRVLLLLVLSLALSACSGKNAEAPEAQPKTTARSAPADDPFAEDDAMDYLAGGGPNGSNVVGDDYFDDDQHLDDYAPQSLVADPLEGWNRFWFSFNDVFIEYAARPVSKAYDFVMPEFLQTGFKNFFRNLRAPVRMANCLLQGKGQKAGVEFSSFFLNTLAGFGGFFDVAAELEPVVPRSNEDFGQTLGVWGMGEGIYLVLPFAGPSNARDLVGAGGDYLIGRYSNPITIIFDDLDWRVDLGISALAVFNSLGDILSAYDTVKGIAVDPYSAMRDGMTQLRRNAIAQ